MTDGPDAVWGEPAAAYQAPGPLDLSEVSEYAGFPADRSHQAAERADTTGRIWTDRHRSESDDNLPERDPGPLLGVTGAISYLRPETGFHRALRMTRASLGLVIIALGLGLALAAALGGLIWVIADVIHKASAS